MLIFLRRACAGVALALLGLGSTRAALGSPARAAIVPSAIARAPHAKPAIFQIVMPDAAVHAGQTVHASVLTSSNVASVEARIKGMGMNLRHAGVGKFTLTYQVPWLPFFFRGDWPVNVIARNVDGVRAERTLKITYQ